MKPIRIEAGEVRSLLWDGDELVDWVGGAGRWSLDGESTPRSMTLSYRFDAAIGSPDRRWVLVYERLGTKGVLLRDGRVVREIDRSYYCAHCYDSPARSSSATARRCSRTARRSTTASRSRRPRPGARWVERRRGRRSISFIRS